MFWFGVAICLLALGKFYQGVEGGDNQPKKIKEIPDESDGPNVVNIHIESGSVTEVHLNFGQGGPNGSEPGVNTL